MVYRCCPLAVLLCSDADARGAPYDVEPLGQFKHIRELGFFNPFNNPAIVSIDPAYPLRDEPNQPTPPPSASYSIPSTQVATVTLPFAQIQLARQPFGMPAHTMGNPSGLVLDYV